MPADAEVGPLVDHLFRREYGKMVAVLTRSFGIGKLGIAEDLVQETLFAAVHHWSVRGIPENPAAWLMAVAKNKALNHIKHAQRTRKLTERLAATPDPDDEVEVYLTSDVADSQLRLMFACCHPDIRPPDQIALVLKTLCGFGSGEIARALLLGEEAVNKRLYRAKQDIQAKGIGLEVPGGAELDSRLHGVCQSLYLLYNEGYSPSQAEEVVRRDLCEEAMRLCLLLVQRFPDRCEVRALLALMHFHTARFDSRISASGAVLFADQDRALWDKAAIATGLDHLMRSATGTALSRFHIEATIAAQHCMASSLDDTNWRFIRTLYIKLDALHPNPLITLNIAIVTARIDGPAVAVKAVEALKNSGQLQRYPLLYATLSHLYNEAGDSARALAALDDALRFTTSPREKGFLARRRALLLS